MPLEVKKHLLDAEQAAERIARFTDRKSFDDRTIYSNPRSSDNSRSLASRESPLEDRTGNWAANHALSAIIAFRNILIHGYDAIDDTVVWDVVAQHLPIWRAELQSLLSDDALPDP
jgi:uncharacterized protein with HEPN domain